MFFLKFCTTLRVSTLLLVISLLGISNLAIAQPIDLEWVSQIGNHRGEKINSVEIDDNGNIYVVGEFWETVDFDPGPDTFNLTSNGKSDIFIIKYNKFGHLLWAKHMGGKNADTWPVLHISKGQKIYLSGTFSDSMDLDPGIGEHFVAANLSQAATFLIELDSSGNLEWGHYLSNITRTPTVSIASDNKGNIYRVGVFSGMVDFDPGPGYQRLFSKGASDIYIEKMDSLGNLIWLKRIGGKSSDGISLIKIDDLDNAYIMGSFRDEVDFDPGDKTHNLKSNGENDIFIMKMNSNGVLNWVRQIGGKGREWSNSFTLDSNQNILMMGKFTGAADFDPGEKEFIMGAWLAKATEVFIEKLDSSGNFIWARQLDVWLGQSNQSIVCDAAGNSFFVGRFSHTKDFDPGTNKYELTSANKGFDLFIEKLGANGDFKWAKQLGGDGWETVSHINIHNEEFLHIAGVFPEKVDFDPSNDTLYLNASGNSDAFMVKLSQCLPVDYFENVTACDSFTWANGMTYTGSNHNAKLDLTDRYGCDSIANLHLTLNYSTKSTMASSACESFTWINGKVYTSSNDTAVYKMQNAKGCDSIIGLDLTIFPLPNTDVTQNGSSLTAKNKNASFQWLDCNRNYAKISGETKANFTPNVDGSYAVEATENACIDTSQCYTIVSANRPDHNPIRIYPNPSHGTFTIDLEMHPQIHIISIHDLQGKPLKIFRLPIARKQEIMTQFSPGCYIIRIQTTTDSWEQKLIIEG